MVDPDESPIHAEYAHPERLVSTDWVAQHLNDPNVVIVETDEDVLLYHVGHIPGAVKIDWHEDLNDPLMRDYLDAERFATMLGKKGIRPDHTVIFYGDNFNWWASYALWVFALFGFGDTRLMNGGRMKWIEEGRELSTEIPVPDPVSFQEPVRLDNPIRAFRDQVLGHSGAGDRLVDVRSPEEFSGEKLHMPDYPQEGAMRGGHIPGANSVPWKRAANDDGTFKSRADLEAIYQGELGMGPSDDVIVYCRIGERSSHTWFVLSQLLGFEKVRNYDGSWTEWGNSVGVPIER